MVPSQSALNSLFYEYKFAKNSPATINNESLIIIGYYSTVKVEVMIVLSYLLDRLATAVSTL